MTKVEIIDAPAYFDGVIVDPDMELVPYSNTEDHEGKLVNELWVAIGPRIFNVHPRQDHLLEGGKVIVGFGVRWEIGRFPTPYEEDAVNYFKRL